MFIKNHKRLFVFLIIAFVVLAAILVLCATAGITPFSKIISEKFFSVAFDKQMMKTVNRIEITDGEKQIVITDPAVVDSVVKESMAATHMGTGCPYERKMNLYCNDRLIRTMYWASCCDSVCVYDADKAHWCLSIEGPSLRGYIYLSESLAAELNKQLK